MKREILVFLVLGVVVFSPVAEAFSFNEVFSSISDFFKKIFNPGSVATSLENVPKSVGAELNLDGSVTVSWTYEFPQEEQQEDSSEGPEQGAGTSPESGSPAKIGRAPCRERG